MAFNGNDSSKEVVKNYKQYTGIAPFKVVAINPNQEQLKALGINAQKEPEYFDTEKVRIDMWMESKDNIGDKKSLRKFTTFLEPKERTNKDNTKNEWINNFGVTAWSQDLTSVPEYPWFKKDGARKAYVGEAQLLNFIRCWVNAGDGDQIFIEKWDDIFRGNMKELRDILGSAKFKNNYFRACMTVRTDDKGNSYEDVYPFYFQRFNVTGFTGWQKHFKDNPTRPNITYTYEVKEFVPKIVTPDADPSAASEWAS